jgi:hypothetical protein
MAANHPVRLRQPAVLGDKILWRNAIAIQKNQIVAGTRCDSAVTYFGKPKALIGMPNVHKVVLAAALPLADNLGGLGPRSVIGNHNLKVAVRLLGKRSQNPVERAGTIVSRDNDGN